MSASLALIASFRASYDADLARIFSEPQRREREAFLAAVGAKRFVGMEAELADKENLFAAVAAGERVAGALPCLRDNSPESARFAALAREGLWEFWTAEELIEIIRDAGLTVEQWKFVANPRWNEAVLKGWLRFEGFYPIFEAMMAEGYEPSEIGWGELWFVACKPLL